MIKENLRTSIILLLSICMIVAAMGISVVRAAVDEGDNVDRSAAWYQTQYGTSPWGGTWMTGQYGPDVGMGQQGMVYQYQDPMTGSFVSYSTTGMGMGMGGPFAGYGGWDSALGPISYGPFAYGNVPQVMPTPGYGTQGSASGGLFGPQTSYYQAQPGLMWMLSGGLGSFGGFGGYGLYSGYGGYGGYPYGFGGWW